MKKYLLFLLLIPALASAQVATNYWKLNAGTLSPNINTWSLTIPQLGGSGTTCVQVNNSGLFSVTGSGCGGSGSGSPFPFTKTSFGVSTTTIVNFINGLMAFSSSTIPDLNVTKFDNLTSNGFLKTSGGNGTLSIDTNSYAPTTLTLTATSPLTGGGDLSTNRSFGCQTASGSQSGCLSSTDWNTFNNKGSNTIATSSVPNIGDLAYWTGNGMPSTLGTLATEAVTCSGNIACTGFTAIGTPSSAISFTGTLPIGNGGTATSTGGVTNGVEYYNGTRITNSYNFIFDGTNVGIGTSTPYTKLSVQGGAVFTGGDVRTSTLTATSSVSIGGGTALTTSNQTGTGSIVLSASPTLTGNAILANASTTNVTISNELNIPVGTAPTPVGNGDVGIDTTNNQFLFYSGGLNVLTGTTTPSFNIASTTLDEQSGSFSTGTTTLIMKNSPEPLTLLGAYCISTSTGSTSYRLGGAATWTAYSTCDTAGTVKWYSSNNTFTAFQSIMVQMGKITATIPSRVTLTLILGKTRQ